MVAGILPQIPDQMKEARQADSCLSMFEDCSRVAGLCCCCEFPFRGVWEVPCAMPGQLQTTCSSLPGLTE